MNDERGCLTCYTRRRIANRSLPTTHCQPVRAAFALIFASQGTIAHGMGQAMAHALDSLFPCVCVLCDAPGQTLCKACRHEATRGIGIGAACPRCAIPLSDGSHLCGRCLKRPPAFDASVAAAVYQGPFDVLVRSLKYSAHLAYAPLLAALLHERIECCTDSTSPRAFDLLIPVPLSRDRMASRGFNQSIEIARPLAKRMKVPLDTTSVLRIRDTPPQAALPFDARRKNIRGAFAVIDSRRSMLEGLSVGIVDDVMTTGSTLDELAATLKRAGVARVVNLVVARTP